MSNPRPDGPRKMARASNDTSLLLTVEAAAKLSGIPYTSLIDAIHDGTLPYVQMDGKKRFWIRRDVLLDHIHHKWHRESA
jgi:excisionase family DNA binding protein